MGIVDKNFTRICGIILTCFTFLQKILQKIVYLYRNIHIYKLYNRVRIIIDKNLKFSYSSTKLFFIFRHLSVDRMSDITRRQRVARRRTVFHKSNLVRFFPSSWDFSEDFNDEKNIEARNSSFNVVWR